MFGNRFGNDPNSLELNSFLKILPGWFLARHNIQLLPEYYGSLDFNCTKILYSRLLKLFNRSRSEICFWTILNQIKNISNLVRYKSNENQFNSILFDSNESKPRFQSQLIQIRNFNPNESKSEINRNQNSVLFRSLINFHWVGLISNRLTSDEIQNFFRIGPEWFRSRFYNGSQ